MTGKQLDELYDISSESLSCCQMPGCLILLQSVKNSVERLQNKKEFVSLSMIDGKKVVNLSLKKINVSHCVKYVFVVFQVSLYVCRCNEVSMFSSKSALHDC